jgi:hypothetical protein
MEDTDSTESWFLLSANLYFMKIQKANFPSGLIDNFLEVKVTKEKDTGLKLIIFSATKKFSK